MTKVPKALAAVTLVVGLVVASSGLAYAYTGPPDGAGKYAHCNVILDHNNLSGGATITNIAGSIACQYGAVSDTINNSGGTLTASITTSGGGATQYQLWGGAGAGANMIVTTNAGGKVRISLNTVAQNGSGVGCSSICSITGFELKWTMTSGRADKSSGIGGSGSGNIAFDNKTFGAAGAAAMPNDFYPGGSAGDLFDVTALTAPTCSRTLTKTGTAGSAAFQATASSGSNGVDTYAWAFGDTGTSTLLTTNHTYANIGAQPDNGWTATLTVTRTGNAGHYFADGSSVKTATCQLRVDFANPDKSTAGSSDSSSGDSDCPSGWGWLDPTAFVGIFKCLFIPTAPDVSSLESTFSSAFPFNVFGQGVDWFNGYATAVYGADSACPGQLFNVQLGSLAHSMTGGTYTSWMAEADSIGVRMPTPDVADCPGDGGGVGATRSSSERDVGNMWGYRVPIRTLEGVLLYVAAGWAVYRRFFSKGGTIEEDAEPDGD